MLTPLEEVSINELGFVTCDIENYPNGRVISIDTCWRDEFGCIKHDFLEQVYIDDIWKQWIEWLKKLASVTPKFRRIWAHNGGGWDWLSLVEYLLRERNDCKISINSAGSKLVVLNIVFTRFTIQLCDSLQLLRSGLDKLSKKFLGIGKVDTNGLLPHEIYQIDRPLFVQYAKTDTENLLLVLEKSLNLVRNKICKISDFGPTIGSTAMSIYRTGFLSQKIGVPLDDEKLEFYRKGYTGGRVELFIPGRFDNIYVYDINSLYPDVMRNNSFPSSDRVITTRSFINNENGCYRIKYYQFDRTIPSVFSSGGSASYSGEGVFFSPEIETFIENGGEIEVLEGYVFVDNAPIFKNYVDSLWELRLSDYDGPLGLLCKFLLNSLYGKFGQKLERDTIFIVESFDQLFELFESSCYDNGGSSLECLDDEKGIYRVTHSTKCAFHHPAIAGLVTSRARAKLYEGLKSVGKGLVYCDTDSVHTTIPMHDSFLGSDIGYYKLEFTGQGVYCGKKLYGHKKRTGEEKIRAKGVSIGGRNGAVVSYDDMCRIAEEGVKLKCGFKKPHTILGVLRGEPSCVFSDRVRTLQKT